LQGFRHTAAALAIALAAAAASGCGERSEPELSGAPEPITASTTTTQTGEGPGGGDPPPPGKPSGPAESGAGDPRVTALERAAARTVREFVAALDRRDGERACSLLAPGALRAVELPRPRGGCAASLRASIGYRDPRGLPVFESAEVAELRSVKIDGPSGRVVATVVTRFADRDEPSIEDDIFYLARAGDGWLIAKASSSLYRAVGIADVPPSVIAPPG
jgi:hypothetical protein